MEKNTSKNFQTKALGTFQDLFLSLRPPVQLYFNLASTSTPQNIKKSLKKMSKNHSIPLKKPN
jgi:hypothetical protein